MHAPVMGIITGVNRLPPLPRSVQEIADVIGEDLALSLIEQLPRAYSGQHRRSGLVILYVPRTLLPGHKLVGMIGIEAAQKLVDAFGGEMLQPATCAGRRIADRNAAIWSMRQNGKTVREIAQEFRISDRQVRNVIREILQVEPGPATVKTSAAAAA